MHLKETLILVGLSVYLSASLVRPPLALAAGTSAGTTIANSATADYKVSGIDQTPVTSNSAEFVVDDKVNLTVVNTGNANVTPGSSDDVLVFTLTNNGNETHGYRLATSGGVDDFDMNNVRIYRDANADGALDGGDVLYVAGTNVADIAEDGSIQLLIVADCPLTPTDGQTAKYNLIATTLDAGTTDVTTEDAGADNPATVQVVFADVAGTDDALRDGKHSAVGTYTVLTASVTVSKTSVVINDPFNGGSNPKGIPGATVRYSITVTNNGSTDATTVVLVDQTPANTTYVAGTITLGGSGLTDGGGDDEGDYNVTNPNSVTVTIATLAAGGGTATVTFDVTVN